jgi:MscS family membrane protein
MDTTAPPLTGHFPVADRLWFFEIIVGILVLIAVNYLFKRLVKHVRHRSISLSADWKEKIDHILYLPFQILLWILGATLVIEILGRRLDFSFFESYIDAFRSSGFVVCAAWALLRWKGVAQKEFMNKDKNAQKIDASFVHVVGKVLSIFIIVISMMIILRVWGLDIAPLIAFGGIGAAAVGFASKDVLANFFGGLMLHVNRPFMVGDFISIPEKQMRGHVEEIGWNTTTLRDKDKRPVYLPNATFTHVLVINEARMTHRRIEEKIGIRYEDFSKIPALVEEIQKQISNHPQIDTHLPILVVFQGFGPCTLDLYMDVYTLQTRYEKFLHVKHEIMMLVYQTIQSAGAAMPTPMVTVSGKISTS